MINSGCLGFRLDDVATELDQLRSGIDFSLKYRACKNHQKVADDFCVLAARYRLKIFETARSNQNINHPAKDVMKTLDLLVSKIDKLNERNLIASKSHIVRWINLFFRIVAMGAN